MKIKCYTLFDITKTNINVRGKNVGDDSLHFNKKRNQQSNFDTILQVINMRSQPEEISTPQFSLQLSDDKWGYLITETQQKIPIWSFYFSVWHKSVFDNGIEELGYLIQDCQGVPMINKLDEWEKLSNKLDTTDALRNIYFEVIDNG